MGESFNLAQSFRVSKGRSKDDARGESGGSATLAGNAKLLLKIRLNLGDRFYKKSIFHSVIII